MGVMDFLRIFMSILATSNTNLNALVSKKYATGMACQELIWKNLYRN